MLETLDYTIRIASTLSFSICISTLPTQHTTFILELFGVPLQTSLFSSIIV